MIFNIKSFSTGMTVNICSLVVQTVLRERRFLGDTRTQYGLPRVFDVWQVRVKTFQQHRRYRRLRVLQNFFNFCSIKNLLAFENPYLKLNSNFNDNRNEWIVSKGDSRLRKESYLRIKDSIITKHGVFYVNIKNYQFL